MNPVKIALPAVLGALFALAVVGWWVDQIIQNSFRTDGTPFNQYATVYPAVKPVNSKGIFWCDNTYRFRWVGCSIQ